VVLVYSNFSVNQQLHCTLPAVPGIGELILMECRHVIERDIPLFLLEGDRLFS